MTVCHASGCSTPIGAPYALCKRHWLMLAKPIRQQLWRLLTDPELRHAAECAHALAAAVDTIRRVECGERLW